MSRNIDHLPSRINWRLPLLAIGLFAIVGRSVADAAQAKCDAFITHRMSKDQASWSNVIVKFTHSPTSNELAVLRGLGVDVYRNLPIIESVAAKVSGKHLRELANLPFVTHLSADASVQKNDRFTMSGSGADVAYSQYNLTGNKIGVAIIDSGVNMHGDFNGGLLASSRVKNQINFVPGSDNNDHCGHGTFVAGIVAGNAANSSGLTYTQSFFGIARRANVFSVKVLDDHGRGTVSQVVSGIQWCMFNAKANNIRIINMSLGHPVGESYKTDPLCQAAESAWKAGIVVVCAAGNDGRLNANPTSGAENEGYGTAYGSIQSPGNDPYVITVGAMKRPDGVRNDDRITTYSSRGPSRLDYVLKPDLVAPGNLIVSTEAKGSYLATTYKATNEVRWSDYCLVSLGGNSDKYFLMSGTSMSAPVVSGAAALMLEMDPTLSPDTIKVRMMVEADKWLTPSGASDPCAYGAGYLDIPKALANTLVAHQYAMSPALGTDANGNVFIDPSNAIWGQRAIWGTDSLQDFRAIWGERALWGNSTNILDASRALWGNGFWSDISYTSFSTSGVDLSAGSTALQGER